jgi:hypothetical protein
MEIILDDNNHKLGLQFWFKDATFQNSTFDGKLHYMYYVSTYNDGGGALYKAGVDDGKKLKLDHARSIPLQSCHW